MGTISDIYGGRRACVIATFTITLIPFLLLFAEFGTLSTGLPTVSLLVLLGVMGCLIGGPINIITSAVAVDLSENSRIGGRTDLMTVTGVINGLGAVIASLGLAFIGPVQQSYGWKCVWYLLTACTLLGTLLLSPIIKKELTRPTPLNQQSIGATSVTPSRSRSSSTESASRHHHAGVPVVDLDNAEQSNRTIRGSNRYNYSSVRANPNLGYDTLVEGGEPRVGAYYHLGGRNGVNTDGNIYNGIIQPDRDDSTEFESFRTYSNSESLVRSGNYLHGNGSHFGISSTRSLKCVDQGVI